MRVRYFFSSLALGNTLATFVITPGRGPPPKTDLSSLIKVGKKCGLIMATSDVTPASIDDLELAMDMGSGGHGEAMRIYISVKTGALVYDAEAFTGEPCPVEDIEEDPDYIPIPERFELDLGQRLVWRFVGREIPDMEPEVRNIFSRRGAYRRYKNFLEFHGLLDAWYTFENNSTREALLEWCRDNEIPIQHEATEG